MGLIVEDEGVRGLESPPSDLMIELVLAPKIGSKIQSGVEASNSQTVELEHIGMAI